MSNPMVWNHLFQCSKYGEAMFAFFGLWLKVKLNAKCQFHQHFMHAFFVRKCFAQLFSSYVLALAKGFLQKSTFVQKCHAPTKC